MGLIQRRQAAVMNQHYQRYSLDYFLDAQQRIGFTSIELWCGAQHFWLDDQHYDDVQSLLRKVQRRGLEVVSLTCPSFCFQYQYAPFSPEVGSRPALSISSTNSKNRWICFWYSGSSSGSDRSSSNAPDTVASVFSKPTERK